MTTLTSFLKTDNVDDHTAADMNEMIAAVLRPEFANTETITATKELADNDCQYQFLTASGANRTVELAPEATTNHVTAIYNSGATYSLVVKDDSGTTTFATLAPDEWSLFVPFNAEGWRKQASVVPEREYKLSVTVSASDLIVALKHLDDTDPSASRPLSLIIAGVERDVIAATSCTLADGTNWMGLGGSMFAALEQDLFAYAIWDSNSSVVAVAPARIPYGCLVSDFNSTNTHENYLGNYANYTSTDPVTVLGRFAATLSAGAGYTWTVPTFTNANLIHVSIYETRRLTWLPTMTGWGGSPPTSAVYTYQLIGRIAHVWIRQTTATTSTTTTMIYTLPISYISTTNHAVSALGRGHDNSVNLTTPASMVILASDPTNLSCYKDTASGAWTAANTKALLTGDIQYPMA